MVKNIRTIYSPIMILFTDSNNDSLNMLKPKYLRNISLVVIYGLSFMTMDLKNYIIMFQEGALH